MNSVKRKFKKNLPTNILSIIIIFIIILIGITSGLVVIKKVINNSPNRLQKVFDNMINLESYNITTGYFVYDHFYNRYDKENIIEEISIDGNFEKSTYGDYIEYNYDNKKIVSEEFENSLIYYYDPYYNSSISNIEVDYYSDIYKEIFKILKKYNYKIGDSEYKKKSDNFEFVNTKYIDEYGDEYYTLWDLEYELEEYIEFIASDYFGERAICTFDACYEVSPIITNLNIYVKDNYINEIVITYGSECYDQDFEVIECSNILEVEDTYKVFIRFDNYNNLKLEFPKSIENSLNETVAGDWVGTYKGNITCSNGKSYEETLELTDVFRVYSSIYGWDINMRGYSCNYDDYTYQERTYKIIDNNLIVYNMFGDVIVEFVFEDNKIIEYDENNNIITTFVKE